MKLTHHTIHNNNFLLSAQRCLFWEEEKTLILSDLHIGKTGHFRKHGIPVPASVYKEDMQRLVSLISFFKTTRLVIVGDMFHSKENKELDFFLKWRTDLSQVTIDLVLGNHDILEKSWYAQSSINISNELQIKNFHFIHDIKDIKTFEAGDYYFSGHFHPAIYIKGLGKQSLSLPCFYFTPQYGILPAFSKFSGNAFVDPAKDDIVYAILESSGTCKKI